MNTLDRTTILDGDSLVEDHSREDEIKRALASNMGGFADMSEDEIENFIDDEDYKNNKTEILQDNTNLNMYGRSVSEIFGLSENDHTLSHNAIECLDIDIMDFEDIVEASNIMQDTLAEGEELLKTFKYLYQDIYMSFIKYSPVMLPPSRVHRSVKMNRDILEQLLNTPEYIALRKNCKLDPFNSALATNILAKEAIEILREYLDSLKNADQQKEALDRLLETEQQMDRLIEQAQQQQQGGAMNSSQEQGNDSDGMTAQQAQAMADQLAQQCDSLIENKAIGSQMAQRMQGQISTADNVVQEVSKVCQGWGLGEGSEIKVSFENKVNAIEKIRSSDKLKKLTDIIGRFKESAITEQKKKAKHGAVEIKSVTVGKKIEDALPNERMFLVNDATKKDFYRRMSESQLLTYNKVSNKEKNKGPIVVCVDTSGSMSGSQEQWSKALTIGVLEVAQLQKRDFACIIYSGYADDPIIIEKNTIDPEKIIACAENFHGGGTNWESPLQKATDLIKNSQFKEADILFITDGECSLSTGFLNKFNKEKEEHNFRCIGVLVDMGSRSSCASMKAFCDDITTVSKVSDLTDSDSETNKSIFGTL